MKKVSIKGASWDSLFLSLAKFLTLLFAIVSTKMLSTALTLEEYGTYSQANLVMGTGTSIILLGLGDALAYCFNKSKTEIDDNKKAVVINTVFLIEISLGVLLALAIIAGKGLIADYFSNNAVSRLLYVVSILPMFSNVLYFMQLLCVSTGRAKWMSLYTVIMTVVRLGAVALSVYVLKDILWIYISIVLMDLVNISLYNMDLRKKGIRIQVFRFSSREIKPILAYGLPMGIYAITSSFTRDLDKFVIGRLGGTEDLAIYTNCSKILPLDFFVTAFAVVLIPYIYRRVSEGKREESIELFSSYMKVGYYTVWVLGMMVLIAPSSVISFLYADAYVAGKSVFVLYILDSMMRFASIHLILTAAGKAKSVMAYSLLSLGLNLALNILFYKLWGMIGPAIATVLVAFVYMLLILSGTKKIINAKWREMFDFKDIVCFVASLMLLWGASFCLNRILLGAQMHQYLAMFISMAVFGFSMLALHYKRIFSVLKKINSFKL